MEPHGIVVVSAPHTHTISCHANREVALLHVVHEMYTYIYMYVPRFRVSGCGRN